MPVVERTRKQQQHFRVMVKQSEGDLRLLQCPLFFSPLLYVTKGLGMAPGSPGLHFYFLVEVTAEAIRCYLPCYKDLSEQTTLSFDHLWGGARAPKELGLPLALWAFPRP